MSENTYPKGSVNNPYTEAEFDKKKELNNRQLILGGGRNAPPPLIQLFQTLKP